jgi:hypothetical protein
VVEPTIAEALLGVSFRSHRRYDSAAQAKALHPFKPKVASSNLVGRIPRSSGSCRGSPVQSELVGRGSQMRSGAFLSVRPDIDLIFTTASGLMWRERNFYRNDVWGPAQNASGLEIRPHECRHSFVSQLRAAGARRR